MSFRILICEKTLFESAAIYMDSYTYDFAYTIEDIYEKTYTRSYDLYIFHMECLPALQNLRQSQDTTPAILVDEFYNFSNFKQAYRYGDDYILKPIYMEELLVKLEYHQRKKFGQRSFIIRYKDFFLHKKTKQLYKDKELLSLSPNEMKLVELFFTNQNKPLPKGLLFEELQSNSDGSLRVYISKLKKIGLDINYQRANSSYQLVV